MQNFLQPDTKLPLSHATGSINDRSARGSRDHHVTHPSNERKEQEVKKTNRLNNYTSNNQRGTMLSSLMEQMRCDRDQSHLKHHLKPSVQSNSASLFQPTIRREREREIT